MLRLITFGGVGLQDVRPGPLGDVVTQAPDLSPRALALLTLLAASPSPGVSRDTLLAYLWPESDMERGRNALRQALHTLKRDLAVPDLLTGGVALRLDDRYVTSDVQEFGAARVAGDHDRAVALYAGPFLHGFHLSNVAEFEQWVEARRAEYAAQTANMLEALARVATLKRDTSAAVEWWRRLTALDPLSTRAAVGLVEALALAGDSPAALRHVQAYEALVHRELGVAPDPQLATLADRLRSGGPAVSAAPRPPALRASTGESRSDEGGSGRERFRDRLIRELSARYIVEQEGSPPRSGPVRSFHARDMRHNRQVTLRVLHRDLASQLDVTRFLREIRLTGELLHPHILPLLDSGEAVGCPWYAVPRFEGETLRDRLGRELRLPVDEALRFTREIADALVYAHEHGIVHRDVHPENILLSGPHALLANLGVARALDTAAGGNLTDTGAIVGSPAYMSPEQAEGKPVDGRSDQYALAAVLVEMLTGEPLFSGPTQQAILTKRAGEPMPSEASLQPLPPPLRAAVLKALAPRPSDRFATLAAFQQALAAGESSDARHSWWSRVRRRLVELLSPSHRRVPRDTEPPGSNPQAGSAAPR